MKIDKSIGIWYTNGRDDITILDEIAYYLYLKDRYYYGKNTLSIFNIKDFKLHMRWSVIYRESKLILRREKIEKILSRGNR